MNRAAIAAALAAVAFNAFSGEVEIAQSVDGDRFMLESETVNEYRDGTRYALVYSYADGQRKPVTFLVAGCDQGFGRATYGATGEGHEKIVKVTWTAAGNKVFDRISYAICRQPATAAQTPEPSPVQPTPARDMRDM